MPAVLTPKVPLTVNAILGILGMALIVLVSMSSPGINGKCSKAGTH